ncbi:hypothetical protein AOLI_G00124040 [Acnodon oligacanthus]
MRPLRQTLGVNWIVLKSSVTLNMALSKDATFATRFKLSLGATSAQELKPFQKSGSCYGCGAVCPAVSTAVTELLLHVSHGRE